MPAIVGKADSYVELPWMAFAAGAAFAAFVIADALRPHWTLSYTALLHATVILSAGGASVLLVIFAPPYARSSCVHRKSTSRSASTCICSGRT